MISQILLLLYNCFRNFTWIFICLMGTERRKCFFCFFCVFCKCHLRETYLDPLHMFHHHTYNHATARTCRSMTFLCSFLLFFWFCSALPCLHIYIYIPLFRCHLANEPTRTKHMAHDTSKLFKAATFK